MEKTRRPGESVPQNPNGPFTAADFPLDEEGRVYHLQVKPEQLAPDILVVGDPGRADMIGSSFLRDLEFRQEHRGLVTLTGTSDLTGEQATIISPMKTTVTTSGMGTPSLEIVLNELVALNEIDFMTRKRKVDFPRLHIIRVGSSGGLQASTELGTLIITSYAIGLDNSGAFYETPYVDETSKRLEDELGRLVRRSMSRKSRFFGKIHPYVARAEPSLVSALVDASHRLAAPAKVGLTVSSPGFFIPQGRDIDRVRPSLPDVDRIFSEFDPRLNGQRVENMEMESSFLLHFLGGLGCWAATICPAIANRQRDTFTADYQVAMENAVKVALMALAQARTRPPKVATSSSVK